MSATICAFILTFSTLCGSRVVSGVLSAPTNVSLTSYNMNLVLRWGPPEGATQDLVYTTEYKTSVTNYNVGCVDIITLECDFTSLSVSMHPPIIEYGTYTGRVRAQLGSASSAWVESEQIILDRDTIIGSPRVSLLSNGAAIDVSIVDPVFVISTLRNTYAFATYSITYWKGSQKEKARHISNTQHNHVILNGLEPWTEYCVQVQINVDRNPNPGQLSETVCESTTSVEEAPWVPLMVTIFFVALAVTLVAVTVVYRKSISHFLCPKDALPQHFKENLLKPPNSTIYLDSHPPVEKWHEVQIIADTRTVEEEGPSGGSKDCLQRTA